MKKVKFFICLIFVCFYASQSFAIDLRTRPDIYAYIQTLNQKYAFNTAQLTRWFNQVNFNQQVINAMTKPNEKVMPWYTYRNIFITDKRIQKGVAFWRDNAVALHNAAQHYGVPEAVIVGIIGVETLYGENTGNYPTFNVLTTLAFQYPRRGDYFKNELTSFLLLARQVGWDPLAVKGSYAAALGLPQFMPSSYRAYAVNAHGTSGADLIHNHEDAIYSVANYLSKHGWQAGEPVAIRADILNEDYESLEEANVRPRFTLQQLQKQYGLASSEKVSPTLRAGVVFLEYRQGDDPWLTFHNFSVIKKYNASNKYAMVVYQLADAIAVVRHKETG